jgi:signal peptidase II
MSTRVTNGNLPRSRRDAGGLRMLWLAGAVIVVDQLTKHLAIAGLAPGEPVRLLPPLDLILSRNTGVSFSMLKLANDAQRWPLVLLSAVMVGALAMWLRRVHSIDS